MNRRMLAAALAVAVAVAACGGGTGSAAPGGSGAAQAGEIEWLLSRPAEGPVIESVQEVAAEFAKTHPGFSLKLSTTPDRPSYLQRVETLAAAKQLPELFDTDATPFAQRLRDQGLMQDVGAFLEETGKLDDFRPVALDYQRFDDGSLYMLPLEYHMEWFWYNTAIFEEVGVTPPQTIEELVELCAPLREAGYVPMAVDGQDQWPLLRQLAFIPFRLTGNDYIKSLKRAEASLSDEPGQRAAQYVYDLGQNECLQEGFSSQGYTDARDLFTSKKAAIFYMGTWELGTFTADDLSEDVAGNIDFFKLPMTEGATTSENEYFVVSGIGMAVNKSTFEGTVKEFLTFLIDEYPAAYAAKQQFPPMSIDQPIPDDATDLYKKAAAEIDNIGEQFGVPWDTQLDPTSNTRMGQELTLLAQGDTTPEDFIATIDAVIKENAPKYFSAP